jgi:hypothetical protein
MKVVINRRFGGFGVSATAWRFLADRGVEETYTAMNHGPRDDPRLVEAVETLGSAEASGSYARLVVVEIPDGTDWHIHEYDGSESIHSAHLTWYGGDDDPTEDC